MSPATASITARHRHPKVAALCPDFRPSIDLEPSSYFRWKGLLDRTLALVLLIPGLPLIGLLVLLVRLTSRGPGIYAQVRVGLRGRLFTMYKVRTMRHDAEAVVGPVWTQARDPRVTILGRVLRKLHLDEVPQLLNVLKGDMSLIGPRPERPEFVEVLREVVPGYLNRLAVRPGVTGLAQVNLPPDSDLADVGRKLVLDCEYIKTAGLLLDVRLLLCTFLRIFKVPERWLHGALGVGRSVELAASAETCGNGVSRRNGEPSRCRVEATPTGLMLQLAKQPNPAASASSKANGSGNAHGSSNGNGANGAGHSTSRSKRRQRAKGGRQPR